MTLSALGIFSAAGAGVAPAGSYELISTTVLGANAANVVFSGLGTYASTYRHLQIRSTGRTARTATTSIYHALFTGATAGTVYAMHRLIYNGTAVSTENLANSGQCWIGTLPAANATANIFGGNVLDILDAFSTTKNKTIRSFDGYAAPTGAGLYSSVWANTSAIETITLVAEGGNLVAGSRFSLYGIKG